jgi:hypothetical protein
LSFGEWDWDTLANDWDVVDLEAWGLEIPQFDTVEEQEMEDLSDKIKSMFKIEVICKDEQEQEKTYNKLIEQNYECRLLTL